MIFRKHGCDKGLRHGYERVYGPVFGPIREQVFTLLEIGIFRGESLAAWLEYLPNATIVAVDTFQRVQPHQIPVLKNPRVRWFQMDSTQEAPTVRADFIIDDGCHDPDAQMATLRNYRGLLNDGRYFIEDAPTLMIPGAKVHDLTKGHQFDSRILEL